jgi:hypothetical protein
MAPGGNIGLDLYFTLFHAYLDLDMYMYTM